MLLIALEIQMVNAMQGKALSGKRRRKHPGFCAATNYSLLAYYEVRSTAPSHISYLQVDWMIEDKSFRVSQLSELWVLHFSLSVLAVNAR